MNSIRNSLGMRETEIAREPGRPWNPHFYAISPKFITRSRAGTCIVVASQPRNTNYVDFVAAPDKEHTITINQATPTTTVTCGAGPFTYPARRSRLAGLASPVLAGSTTR